MNDDCPVISSPPCLGLEEATVDSLKAATGTSWDMDILRDLFYDVYIAKIMM